MLNEQPIAKTERIRTLNDELRKTFLGGCVMTTRSVGSLNGDDLNALINLVSAFDQFTSDNDPHGEHDFGAVELNGERYFWKIDYFDTALNAGSPDPADPKVTGRVLTIMRADEY